MSAVQPLPLEGPAVGRGPLLRALSAPAAVRRPVEHEKHDRVLAACGAGPFPRALLLGTAGGVLPDLLADRCLALSAVDPSSTAVAVARERLSDRPWARVDHGLLPAATPPAADGFDLVVVADVLRALSDEALRRTIDRLLLLLRPGARVVAVHWCGQAPGLARTATDAHRALRRGAGLRHVGSADVPGARGHLLDVYASR